MKVVRKGIFETNSSSSHSISIVGGIYTPDTFPIENGVCKVYPGEFGWEEYRSYSAAVKASYCLTYIKIGKDDAVDDDDTQSHMLRNVLKKVTGCEVEFMPDPVVNTWDQKWGFIDHQSYDICSKAFESEDSLRNFIFNRKSYLETDNDNH